KDSRVSKEHADPSFRPEMKGPAFDPKTYDVIILGYPIWYSEAPAILYSFVESADLSGKTVIPFCSSGSSPIGDSVKHLAEKAPGSKWTEGKRFAADADAAEAREWAASLGLNEAISSPLRSKSFLPADLTESKPFSGVKAAVVYFSASGNTKKTAEQIAGLVSADLYEITPEEPYTEADLAHGNGADTRTTRERADKSLRPGVKGPAFDPEPYSVILLGYPVWFGEAPNILYTFVEKTDLSGKTVIPFCTSAGSPIGDSAKHLAEKAPGSEWTDGKRFAADASPAEIEEWVISQGLTAEQTDISPDRDKTYPRDGRVNCEKVTFKNRYGISLTADMFTPKNKSGRLPGIAVCGPFGAVKEQVSGRYAQEMAARGFVTVAFDPSYTGESGGEPRNVASPDINTEDFQAAVDFLSTRDNVDPERVGIIGICGWGGMALNAAALDTRIKATVTSTMYDMTRQIANGYDDAEDAEEARYQKKQALNKLRTEDFKKGSYGSAGPLPEVDEPDEDTPQFVKDYVAYYKTPLGFHERSVGSNQGWNEIGCMSFLNQPLLQYSNEIRSAVLMIHGEKAHSLYFSRDAFHNMINGNKYTGNKRLLIIPGANHTDLYYKMDVIPFGKMEEFFNKYLK
ncbi:MAG: acetylxylan esterase, partial [Abditibacteriota bacterium]|nr:acetylxylan esterase [Abditibacteriota bacterium]